MFLDNRDSIHHLMVEVTRVVKLELNTLSEAFAKRNEFPSDYKIVLNSRNQSKNWLRPFLTAFFMSEKKDWELSGIKNILTSVELFNISTYQSDYCFDNQVATHLKNNQFIYSMLTYDAALQLVANADSRHVSDEKKYSIINDLRSCNSLIYIGQFEDLNYLNIHNLELFNNNADFIDIYKKRCRLISNTVPLCARVGMTMCDLDKKTSDIIYSAVSIFGLLIQVVNDISNCLKMHGNKENSNRYSDFHNGKLTLPLYMFYKQYNINSEEQLIKYNNEELDKLFTGFFEEESNVISLYSIMLTLWKDFVSRLSLSGYNFKEFCAYLYSFVFRTNYLPLKIRLLK